jgi:hypothetical protein
VPAIPTSDLPHLSLPLYNKCSPEGSSRGLDDEKKEKEKKKKKKKKKTNLKKKKNLIKKINDYKVPE